MVMMKNLTGGNRSLDPSYPAPARRSDITISPGHTGPASASGLADPQQGGGPRTASETSPGYLGFTSFSAVYRETQDSLSLIQGGGASASPWTRKDPGSLPGSPRHAVIHTMSPRTLETCLAVLQRLPDEEGALALFLRHTNPSDGWIREAARRVVESLTDTFKRELRARRAADLERMALLISTNTARPWVDDEPDSEKWLASFSGRNLRWESLGILFTYCKCPFRGQHHISAIAM